MTTLTKTTARAREICARHQCPIDAGEVCYAGDDHQTYCATCAPEAGRIDATHVYGAAVEPEDTISYQHDWYAIKTLRPKGRHGIREATAINSRGSERRILVFAHYRYPIQPAARVSA